MIPPNIDLLQEEFFDQDTQERQMFSNGGTLPWAFLLDASTCNVDMKMVGFGMRDSSSFVVSGYFSTSDIASDCPSLATSQVPAGTANTYNFISSQSVSGLVYWYKSLRSANSVISSMSISTDNVLVTYQDESSTASFRVVKLSISTGAWAAELKASAATGLSGTFGISSAMVFRSQYTLSSYRNYVVFQTSLDTHYFASLLRFDESFTVAWTRIINDVATTPLLIYDLDVSQVSGKFSVACGYLDVSNSNAADSTRVFVFNETTGQTIDEFSAASQRSQGNERSCQIRMLYSSDAKFVMAYHLMPTGVTDFKGNFADKIQLALGTLVATTFTISGVARFDTGIYGSSPQIEAVTATQIVFTVVEEPFLRVNYLEAPIVRIYFLDASLSVTQTPYSIRQVQVNYNNHWGTNFNPALMRYYTTTSKATGLYIAYNAQNMFDFAAGSDTYPGRIMYYKVNPTILEAYGAECGTGSIVQFTSSPSTPTFSQSVLANIDDAVQTQAKIKIATQKLGQAAAITNAVVVYDQTSSLTSLSILSNTHFPEKGVTAWNINNSTGFATYVDTGKTGLPIYYKSIPSASTANATNSFTIGMKGCRASGGDTTYSCTGITYPNGTSVNLNLTQKIQLRAFSGDSVTVTGSNAVTTQLRFPDTVTLSNVAFVNEYIGSRTLKLTCSYDVTTTLPNMIVQPYVRYNIEPTATAFQLFAATTAQFLLASQCTTPAFPIFMGDSDGNVEINVLRKTSISTTTFVIAGASNTPPFASSSTINQGFIALLDSFGIPIWIYNVQSDTPDKQSECYDAVLSQSTEANLGFSTTASTAILAVCKVWNQEYLEYQALVVGLKYLSGSVVYARYLPRNLAARTYSAQANFANSYRPEFISEIYSSYAGDLLIGLNNIDYGTNSDPHYTPALLLLNTVTGKQKFYTSVLDSEDAEAMPAVDFLPFTGGAFFLVTHNTEIEHIYSLNPYSSSPIALFNGNSYHAKLDISTGSKDGFYLKTFPFLDTATHLVVPVLNTVYNYLDIYVVTPILTNINSVSIKFTTCSTGNCAHNFNSVIGIDFQDAAASPVANYYFLLSAQDKFMLLMLPRLMNVVTSAKVWQPADPVSYNFVGILTWTGATNTLIAAASGNWNGHSYSSSIIFRINPIDITGVKDLNDYSCVSFRSLRPQEYNQKTDYLYYYDSSPRTNAYDYTGIYLSHHDYAWGTNYDSVFQFESEWLNDANGVSFSTFIYAEPYDWGFSMMPNTYDFRVPQLMLQCGTYSRKSDFAGYSKFQTNDGTTAKTSGTAALTQYEDYGDHFVAVTMGEIGFIKLNAPTATCQYRPIEVLVFSAGNDTLKIETTWITYDATNLLVTINAGKDASEQQKLAAKSYSPTRMLSLQDNMGIASPGSYALVIRYADVEDPSAYYDHAMNVVIRPIQENADDFLHNDYECYQNPYPTSFGGCSDGCEMIMYDFQELASTATQLNGHRTDIVISGSVAQAESFMEYPYTNKADAFLMKINDVAIPQWYTIFSVSRTSDDAITAVTSVNGIQFAYCYLTTDPGQTNYNLRQSTILKVDLSNGLLNSQYGLNLYNKYDGGLFIHDVGQIYDAMVGTSTFAFSFIYSSEAGTDYQRLGTIRITDGNANTATQTQFPWTIDGFSALRQEYNYDYVVGSHAYTTGDTDYWQAHLAQQDNNDYTYMYLLNLDSDAIDSSAWIDGYKFYLHGDIDTVHETLQPKIIWDEDVIPNLYVVASTETRVFLVKYNFTANPDILSLYRLTQLSPSLKFGTNVLVNSIDIIYRRNADYSDDFFLLALNLWDITDHTTMLYFLQINRVDFKLVTSSYIRSDGITGGLNKGRLAFAPPFAGYYSDYFYYVRNVNSFTNIFTDPTKLSANNEVLVNRKSYFFSGDNEFDCQASNFISDYEVGLTEYETYSTDLDIEFTYQQAAWSNHYECVFTQTQLTALTAAPTNNHYFCVIKITLDYGSATQFMIFDPEVQYEDGANILLPSPYINQVQMIPTDLVQVYPQQELLTSTYGFGTETCAAGTGIQRPTTIDMDDFEYEIGTQGYRVINQHSFMQCQAQAVNYTFLYEDGTTVQSAQNVFATFTESNSTFSFDLETFSPAPGVRLFQFQANTEGDTRDVKISQPFVILPQDFDADTDLAPVEVDLPLECIADNEYPKVIGELMTDFFKYGQDIHPASGNILLCGQTNANTFPNSHWAQTLDVAMNMMSDLAGRIYWSYAVTYIPNTADSISSTPHALSYRQCQFADDEYVFSLLHIDSTGSSGGTPYGTLVLVKQTFGYGVYQYAKVIPGQYTGNYFGFSLISYDQDNDQNTDNSLLFGYVYGNRNDIQANTQNHFTKIYMQDTDYPYQVWTAYTSITGYTSGNIQKTGASTNSVYALSHLTIAGSKYANIVKYDAESGEQQESVTYPASLNDPDISFIVDYPYDLIYLSAAHVTSETTPITFNKYIKRFDLYLVPDGANGFTVTLNDPTIDYSALQFKSDIAFNVTHLYETFCFTQTQYYIVIYLRQTLKALQAIHFYSSQISIENLGLSFFWDGDVTQGPFGQAWLLHIQTSKGFLSEDHYSLVITRLNYTEEGALSDPNSCLDNYYTNDTTTLLGGSYADLSKLGFDTTQYSFFYRPTYYKLQPQQYLYFEQKLWPEQISFQPALNLDCRSPGLVFPEELEHQIIILPMNKDEDRTYSFYLPDVCDPTLLTVTMTVDGMTTLPSFLSGSSQMIPEGNFYRIVFNNTDIDDTDAGIYNIQIKLQQNSATAQGSFILSIYPTVPYGDDVESFECEDKYNFMSYGESIGTIFTHIDLDTKTQDYVLCGANKVSSNVQNGNIQYSAFVQSNTQGHAVKWHLQLKSGNYDNIAQYCAISGPIASMNNQQMIYTVINSENENQVTLGSQMNNSIYLFQHSLNARFVNSKQIQNSDSNGKAYLLQAEGFELDTLGNLYVSGTVDGYTLSHNSLGFFIFKLDATFNLAFFSVFDFGRAPVGGELLFNGGAHPRLYSIFGYLSDYENAHRWGLIVLDPLTGLVEVQGSTKVATTLANGTTATRNTTRQFYQQGLILDHAQTYLYTCLIYKASEMHDEIALTQHDASNTATALKPTANLEFSRGWLNLESCHIQEQRHTGNIVMAIGTFEYTHIFAFKSSQDANGKNVLSNVTDIGLVYYHQRYIPFKIQMFETIHTNNVGNFFSLYIRTMGFDQNDDKVFITKFSDVTTPDWSAPCEESEIQLNTTSTFYLSFNTENQGVEINGIPVNEINKWTTIDYNFKQVSNLTLNDYYLKNPQKFVQVIDVAEDHVYRASFLNCSRYSYPTVPEVVINENSTIQELNSTLIVGSESYVITFNPFMSCSYDDLTHEIVYQDGSTIATFLVFNEQSLTLTIKANSNEYAGKYQLSYRAYDTEDSTFIRNVDFMIIIVDNQPPYAILNGFTEDFTLYTGQQHHWTVELDFDPEDDTAIFDVTLLDTTGTEVSDQTWFTIETQNSTALIFTANDAPLYDTVNGDEYFVNVSIGDAYNYDTPRTYQISLSIKANSAPILNTERKQLNLDTQYVSVPFEFILTIDDFFDSQGDKPVFNCDILSTTGLPSTWINQDTNKDTGSLTFTGTAPTNNYAGIYYFYCAVTDEFLSGINLYQFVLPVLENQAVVLTQIQPVTVVRKDFHIWGDLAQACVDPEEQPITRTISIQKDGVAIDEADFADNGFTVDAGVPSLWFDFDSASKAGEYVITMTCDDLSSVNLLVTMDFILHATDNLAPVYDVAFTGFDNIEVLVSTSTIYLSYNISAAFSDPESEPLYYELTDTTGNALNPLTIMGQTQDGQLGISIIDSNTPATYDFMYTAFDPLGQYAYTTFSILVYPCDVTCLTCSGKEDTQCLTCDADTPNLYNLTTSVSCYDTCPPGSYVNLIDSTCNTCPEGSATCTGADPLTEALTCDTDYLALAQLDGIHVGCYYLCPQDYVSTGTTCISVSETPLKKDCNYFIANFTTATNSYVESFESMAEHADPTKAVVSCTDPRTEDRILAIQCRQTNEATPKVYIQVATNSLPPHCTADGVDPEIQKINFEVLFSPKISVLTSISMNTQSIVDTKQCNSHLDWTNVDNLVNAAYGYTGGAVTPVVPQGIVGVAVNGVPIHAGVSENFEDFAFPKTATKRIEVDECLGALSKSATHFYQYYSFSPCVYYAALAAKSVLQSCNSLTNCPNDPIKYSTVLNYPKSIQLRKNYFGIALDGHMISGPFISDFTLLQPCDVDACNGYTSQGHYVYGSTLFYPYTVACWGPANTQSMYPATCSNNNNVCLAQSSYSLFGMTLNFVLVLCATLLMFY